MRTGGVAPPRPFSERHDHAGRGTARLAVVDRLDVVAVRVEHEGAVVVRVVFGAQAGVSGNGWRCYGWAMKPRISLITLGVDDLERAVRFYRDGLGLETPGIVGTEFEHGAVAFFDLQPGLKLALWPRVSLAHDTGLPAGAGSPLEFSLAHNVRSREEVDAVIAQALAAGGKLVKAPQDTFYGGYAGYFQDPDAHLWEVAWNPAMLTPE